ncbi:MAG TPA: type II toxin-antitoxin system VapC family toxin [Rhodoblastus sp.]|nr:type II toxin-antitoxin system VapC family toxin [Rhodoblastus sp.]
MVVDTSALAAILFLEPEAADFARMLAAAPLRLLSAVTRVELSIVVEARKGEAGRAVLERLLREGEFETAPVTARHADLAIEAYRRFGKGRHRAGLNIGDCFSYALAKATGESLLFKGDDFSQTDVPMARASSL